MAERTFVLNKLVTDRAFEGMLELYHNPRWRPLGRAALEEALVAKVSEEQAELDAAVTEIDKAKELQDYIRANSTLEALRQFGNEADLGEFRGKTFVYTVTLDEDDPWMPYYTADPEKFEEIKL